MTAATPRLAGFRPARPWFHPGGEARFQVRLEAPVRATVSAVLELHDLDRVVAHVSARWRLGPGTHDRALALRLPPARRVGYSARLTVRTGTGRVLDAAERPLEALDGWWDAPRHACLTDFRSEGEVAGAGERLAEWNVTVVQLYDWMYRHYRYLPPGARRTFDDALGRFVSLDAVKEAVRSCHASGVAALAYGSVYGAEREYAARHPEEIVQRNGEPVSLGGTFFITDLRPGSGWRARLLREYARACRALAVDGIHMDQYGREFRGRAADGSLLDWPRLFRGLVDEADALLRRSDPGLRVLFNAVGAWPLRDAVQSASAATYLELWPPDTRYRDVVARIDAARALAPEKQVIIAAYLSTFPRGRTRPRGRSEAALLLGSVIVAAGAHWHGIAGGDRLLVDGYYPLAAPLTSQEIEALRALWRFSARYHHVLHAGRPRPALPELELRNRAGRTVPVSDEPRAGAVWVRAVERPAGGLAVNLVDLRAQADDAWDSARTRADPASGWTLRLPVAARRVSLSSPWSGGGLLRPVPAAGGRAAGRYALPTFTRWALVLASDE